MEDIKDIFTNLKKEREELKTDNNYITPFHPNREIKHLTILEYLEKEGIESF